MLPGTGLNLIFQLAFNGNCFLVKAAVAVRAALMVSSMSCRDNDNDNDNDNDTVLIYGFLQC